MAKYVEEYLVALGFDLDSAEGQQYVKMLDDIEKRHQTAQKSGEKANRQAKKQHENNKQSVEDGKQQIQLVNDLGKTARQMAAFFADLGDGNMFGAFAKGAVGAKMLRDFVTSINNGLKQTETNAGSATRALFDSFGRDAKKPAPATPQFEEILPESIPTLHIEFVEIDLARIKMLEASVSKNFEQPEEKEAAQSPPKVRNTVDVFKNAKEQAKGEASGNAEARSLRAGMAGEAGEAAGAAGAEGAGALGGAAAAAIPAAIAVAAVAATVAIGHMADSLAQANVEVESMAAKMWISTKDAWNLNSTLQAMGKNTSDLNDIALNPTLRKQFQTLQDYQKTVMQLPNDFEAVNQKWSEGVNTTQQELNMSVQYMKTLAAYDLMKVFEPFFEGWNKFWGGVVNGIIKVEEFFGGISDDEGGKSAGSSDNSASVAPTNYAAGGYYAPSTSTYNTSSSSNVKIENSPQVTVYANTSDPQSVANAASSAVGSSLMEHAALVKSLSGHQR